MSQSVAVAAFLALAAPGAAPVTAAPAIVFCAPGYPGTTAQAQPTMDGFARYVEGAASLRRGSLQASYFETEASGLERLRGAGATLAIVTLPFYAKYRDQLSLTARLRVVAEEGGDEVWSLVARRGAVANPAALAGWEVVGIPAFAPDFVRGPILGAWGSLPASTRLTFSARVPSALLKAAAGQQLAVLVDSAQAAALPSHPNAAQLEIVARSQPLPSSVVCSVGERAPSREADKLLRALPKLADGTEGKEALRALRLARFEPLDPAALDAALGAKPRPASRPR